MTGFYMKCNTGLQSVKTQSFKQSAFCCKDYIKLVETVIWHEIFLKNFRSKLNRQS